MLTREKIMNGLKRLGEELKAEGKSGEILLTGGAAMCLVHSARDMTKDIDALYEPKEEINRLVKKIAEQEGLPEDWLNDGVKGFVAADAPVEEFMNLQGLKITAVTPEYLLSMKLMSARYGEKDAEDIRFLMDKLEIKTVDEAFAILTQFYPAKRVLPKTMYVIQEYIDELQNLSQEQGI
jgi:hypothetical protein